MTILLCLVSVLFAMTQVKLIRTACLSACLSISWYYRRTTTALLALYSVFASDRAHMKFIKTDMPRFRLCVFFFNSNNIRTKDNKHMYVGTNVCR